MSQTAQAVWALLGRSTMLAIGALAATRGRDDAPRDSTPPRPDVPAASTVPRWQRPTTGWKIANILFGAVIAFAVGAFANLITSLAGGDYARTSTSTDWFLFVMVGGCIYAWWIFVYGSGSWGAHARKASILILVGLTIIATIVDVAFSPVV